MLWSIYVSGGVWGYMIMGKHQIYSLRTIEEPYQSAKSRFSQWNTELGEKKKRKEKLFSSPEEKGEFARVRILYKGLLGLRSALQARNERQKKQALKEAKAGKFVSDSRDLDPIGEENDDEFEGVSDTDNSLTLSDSSEDSSEEEEECWDF